MIRFARDQKGFGRAIPCMSTAGPLNVSSCPPAQLPARTTPWECQAVLCGGPRDKQIIKVTLKAATRPGDNVVLEREWYHLHDGPCSRAQYLAPPGESCDAVCANLIHLPGAKT